MRRLFFLYMGLSLVFIFFSSSYSQNDFPNGLSHELNGEPVSDWNEKHIENNIKCKIHWQRKADMPEARRNLKIAAVGNKIFALGGYAEPHKGGEKGNFCYDIERDTWSVKSDMLSGRSNFAMASVNGKLYAIGGDKFLDKCEVYNPETDLWAAITPLPTARQHINCSVIDGRIYVVGGRINWSENPQEALINTHEVYDIKSNSWNTIAPFPQKTENPSLSAVSGKLYVMDGYSRSLREYDPAKNVWEERNKIPSAHVIAGAAVINDKIFVLEGVRPGEDFSRLFVYDPAADSWSETTSLPVGVKLCGFTSVNSKLYAVGGCDQKFIANNYIFVGEIEE
jgi:N-acetylneuraminic acid mutarotase